MAPVHHGHFSFNVDTFYAASSNGHIHPRATQSDLEAIFNTAVQDRSSRPDDLGHWYEAQILHYGLAPTKHKATAKMRLLEAIQQGSLKVPKYILKIEEDLRKEWIKQDSEREKACLSSAAIQISLDPGTLRATMAVATHCRGFNRLLDDSHESVDEASMEINMQSQQRRKRTTPQTQNKKRKLNSEERTTRPVQTARRQGGTSRDNQARSNTYPSSEPYPILTSTFIENRHDPSVRDRTLQQAECQSTRPLNETDSHGRDSTLDFDDVPAPADPDPADDHCSYDYVPETYLSQSFPPWPIKGRLGLINGEYDIFSDDFEAWPEEIPQGGFNLALCLDGQKIWGQYDFGTFHGIIYLSQCPMQASLEKHPFTWRGKDSDGVSSFARANEGWLRFLGDGEIEGEINCCGWLEFRGKRCSGQGMYRPRDLYWLKQQWDKLGM